MCVKHRIIINESRGHGFESRTSYTGEFGEERKKRNIIKVYSQKYVLKRVFNTLLVAAWGIHWIVTKVTHLGTNTNFKQDTYCGAGDI